MNIQQFLDYLTFERNASPLTVENYRSDLEFFEQYFKRLDETLTWETIDSDVVRDWMADMMDRGIKARSVNRRLSALRSFYRYAIKNGLIGHDPVHTVRNPKAEKPLPQYLREKEMDQLIDHVEWGTEYKNVRTRTIIILFYETGIRVSELTGLDDRDVSFINHQLKVTGKRDKQRIIPFGEELAQTLRSYMELRDSTVDKQSTALFLDDKGRRMSADKVRQDIKGPLSLVCTLKKRSPHVLRHTFATAMLNHEAGIESVRKLLGHERLETTEIYTHTTFEQMKRVYKNAHPRA